MYLVHVWQAHTMVCVRQSEDNLWELVCSTVWLWGSNLDLKAWQQMPLL